MQKKTHFHYNDRESGRNNSIGTASNMISLPNLWLLSETNFISHNACMISLTKQIALLSFMLLEYDQNPLQGRRDRHKSPNNVLLLSESFRAK